MAPLSRKRPCSADTQTHASLSLFCTRCPGTPVPSPFVACRDPHSRVCPLGHRQQHEVCRGRLASRPHPWPHCGGCRYPHWVVCALGHLWQQFLKRGVKASLPQPNSHVASPAALPGSSAISPYWRGGQPSYTVRLEPEATGVRAPYPPAWLRLGSCTLHGRRDTKVGMEVRGRAGAIAVSPRPTWSWAASRERGLEGERKGLQQHYRGEPGGRPNAEAPRQQLRAQLQKLQSHVHGATKSQEGIAEASRRERPWHCGQHDG